MITIKCTFLSEGETIKKTAILSDNLKTLSQSEKNECFEVSIELYNDGFWSIFLEGEPGVQYEIEFVYDLENHQQTLEPIKAITWQDDVITDSQSVTVKTRYI